MDIKFLQLNLQAGVLIEEVVKFIEKNDLDIINFQEVAGGSLALGKEKDCFKYLKDNLSGYTGVLANTWKLIGDENSYFGIATFFKNNLNLLDQEIVWMNDFAKIKGFFKERPEDIPKNALILKFNLNGKIFFDINTHLAWGPTAQDKEYKVKQAKILYESLKKITEPFVFSGDFNVTPDTQTVKMFEDLGENLTSKNKVLNTLNLKIHYAKDRIPPSGYPVDYIFTGKGITCDKFEVLEKIDLSDHYGLLSILRLP
ncbi:hypothetical protein M1307_02325 [Patescibacteria group bacterium]|nr:hypothetical protein [Patescibacteria group bacterium]